MKYLLFVLLFISSISFADLLVCNGYSIPTEGKLISVGTISKFINVDGDSVLFSFNNCEVLQQHKE